MNPVLLIGGLLVAGTAVAVLSSEKTTARGLPTDRRFEAGPWKAGRGRDFNGVAYAFDGKFIGADAEHAKAMLDYVAPKFAALKAGLPADASFYAGDKYSSGAYWWPYYHSAAGGSFNTPSQIAMVVIDEYGRTYDIDYSQSGMLANLWASPLFRAAVMTALLASGYGVPAYAALQAYQLRGGDLSLKNVALQSARAYVVGQCGPVCGAAFDFGVGVASGKSADEAAVDAALAQMTPEQREAVAEGRRAYQELRAT